MIAPEKKAKVAAIFLRKQANQRESAASPYHSAFVEMDGGIAEAEIELLLGIDLPQGSSSIEEVFRVRRQETGPDEIRVSGHLE